jgi:hypothetical protein
VKIDLGQAQEYAKAVYKNTDEYVASLSPDDLDREIDMPGFPKMSAGGWIALAAVVHPSNHIGEISAMKGIKGGKGYPF